MQKEFEDEEEFKEINAGLWAMADFDAAQVR